MPTRYGDIAARWTSRDGGHLFDLHVTTPKNTSGTIAVPAGKRSVILVDGRVVTAGVVDGYARLNVRGGTHTIVVLNR